MAPPFVRSASGGRRYATMEDFRNFVKLGYMSKWLHHSGGTVCEPTDVAVNKRHLDMLQAHMTLSDKPYMGSVTEPVRAEDSVEMSKLLFGADFVDQNTVMTSLININSPLTFDFGDDGRARGVCPRQPSLHHFTLYRRRRDGADHCRGHAHTGAGRGAGGRSV